MSKSIDSRVWWSDTLSRSSPVRERESHFGIGVSPRLNQIKARRWLARGWRDVTDGLPAQRQVFMRRNKRRSSSLALILSRTDRGVSVWTEKPKHGQERLVRLPQRTAATVSLVQVFAWECRSEDKRQVSRVGREAEETRSERRRRAFSDLWSRWRKFAFEMQHGRNLYIVEGEKNNWNDCFRWN